MKAIVSRLTNSWEAQEGKEEISERRPWINAGRKKMVKMFCHIQLVYKCKRKDKRLSFNKFLIKKIREWDRVRTSTIFHTWHFL